MKIKEIVKYIFLSLLLISVPINAAKKKPRKISKPTIQINCNKLLEEGENILKEAKAQITKPAANQNEKSINTLFYDASLKFITAAKRLQTNKKYKEAFEAYQKVVQSIESLDRKKGNSTDFYFDYLIVFEAKIKTNSMAKKAGIKNFEAYFLKKDAQLLNSIRCNKTNKKSIKTKWNSINKIYFKYNNLKKELDYIDSFLE